MADLPANTQTSEERRSDAVHVIDSAAKIEALLDDVPHGIARRILAQLRDIRGIVDEAFPGGYWGLCESCDEAKGSEEIYNGDDVAICLDCLDEQKDAARNECSPKSGGLPATEEEHRS